MNMNIVILGLRTSPHLKFHTENHNFKKSWWKVSRSDC